MRRTAGTNKEKKRKEKEGGRKTLYLSLALHFEHASRTLQGRPIVHPAVPEQI
jgi:hypothetical protein